VGQLSGGDEQVAANSGWTDTPPRKGFFTDTSICIGCKACEVACKEWNGVPDNGFNLLGSSYDNTGALGASTWRHVAFIEQPAVADDAVRGDATMLGTDNTKVSLGMPSTRLPGEDNPERRTEFRWLMSSDVCKHCTHAACLDVCPTGSLFRTEFGTVVVQDEICNGCGYCVPACPFGVIDRRVGEQGTKNAGIAQKCTLCYDRLQAGHKPACAQACPTESIQFGDLEELRERAAARVDALQASGVEKAQLYLEDPDDGIGGGGSIFLLLDDPEVYGFPPDPIVTTAHLPQMWKQAAAAALALVGGAVVSFIGRKR
jgi:formate dehydrogenase iron-sulfur subunit